MFDAYKRVHVIKVGWQYLFIKNQDHWTEDFNFSLFTFDIEEYRAEYLFTTWLNYLILLKWNIELISLILVLHALTIDFRNL